MHPALIVNGDDGRIRKCMGCFHRTIIVHSHVERPTRLGRPSEENSDSHVEPLRHFRDTFIPDRIPRNVDGRTSLIAKGQYESDDIAAHRLETHWPVTRRRGSDTQCASRWCFHLDRLPGRKPSCIAAKAIGACRCSQHLTGFDQRRAASMVEILEMLVM